MTSLHDFTVVDIDGKEVSLSAFRDQVLLIVNTASRCGFTPQYAGLEQLYRQRRDRGFTILGFPCNQFAAQEPGSEDEVRSFCSLEYGVTFPMMRKIDVNGDHAAPVYKFLRRAAPGLLGSEAIKWNFTKFLVARDGRRVQRFAPMTKPESLGAEIDRLLAEPPPATRATAEQPHTSR